MNCEIVAVERAHKLVEMRYDWLMWVDVVGMYHGRTLCDNRQLSQKIHVGRSKM